MRALRPPSSIVDGRLRAVSASQIKMFRLCPLKWYHAKVLKVPMKRRGKGAELGDECHKRLEHYLKTGEDVRGPIERHGHEMIAPFLEHAPFNSGIMHVEGDISGLQTPGGVEITGRFDALIHGKTATIIDHKFKKDLEKWADTKEALLRDEQFIIYGMFAVSAGAENVVFRHHNHQTVKRKNLVVEVSATSDEVRASFDALCRFVDDEMAPAVSRSLSDINPDVGGCSAFGGCDFLGVCPSSPRKKATGIFGLPLPVSLDINSLSSTGGDMALLDALKSKPVQVEVATPKPETAVKPQSEVAPTKPALTLLVDCMSPAAIDATQTVLNLARDIAKQYGVADIRVAPKESDLAYGGWRAAIAVEAIKLNLSGLCYVASSELTEPAIEALSGVAAVVIRGRR